MVLQVILQTFHTAPYSLLPYFPFLNFLHTLQSTNKQFGGAIVGHDPDYDDG